MLLFMPLLAATTGAARAQTDWPTYAFTPQRMGYNPAETTLTQANVGQLALAWSANVAGPVLTQPTVLSGVVTAGGTVDLLYVATLYGDVYALNAASGAVVWHHAVPSVQPVATTSRPAAGWWA